MKTIFNSNNRGKSTLYILFAVAVLSFAALLLLPLLLGVDISPLALLFALMCIMFLGGILIQMRSGPQEPALDASGCFCGGSDFRRDMS